MPNPRRTLLPFAAALAIAAALTVAAPAAALHAEGAGPAPEAVLSDLLEGNRRFVDGRSARPDLAPARRTALVAGQHPKAVVLGCSDSRVPPEHLFDQGLGDLFVVRLAGNVATHAAIGSIEYAVEHLGTGVVVVLGHTSCGAVKATLDGAKPEGPLGSVIREIAPAVEKARRAHASADLALDAVRENAWLAADSLTRRSSLLHRLVAEGKVKIVVAVYDLATGAVTQLDRPQSRGATASR